MWRRDRGGVRTMSFIKIGKSRGRGFLNYADSHLGFNPSMGFQSQVLVGCTKSFGVSTSNQSSLTTNCIRQSLSTQSFSRSLNYEKRGMRGNNRGYRGRVFQICEDTLHEVERAHECYRGVLKFKNGEKRQFVSSNPKLSEEAKYELYAGGLDSRPTTGTVIHIVQVREVTKR